MTAGEAWPSGLAEVLDFYDVRHRATEGWQKCRCPTDSHRDAHPSCSVNLGSNYLECHACGFSGSAVDLISVREGVDHQAAESIYTGLVGTSDGDVSSRVRGQSSGRVRKGSGFRPGYRAASPGLRRTGGGWV